MRKIPSAHLPPARKSLYPRWWFLSPPSAASGARNARGAALPASAVAAKGEENESPSTSAEDYKTQKAQKAAEKKRRAELEETLRGIEEEFLLPENQRDAAALLAIQKRKDNAEAELADCYERWETLAD